MKILFTILIISISGIHHAQHVTGIVTSEGEPAIGATVKVLNKENTGDIVDSEGFYKLALPAGNYELEARAVGLKPLRKRLTVESTDVTLNFKLEPSSLGLDEIVISGTMQPVYITESPVKVEVVTADYLNTFIPAASSSIIEGIKLVNGVQEVVACGVCFTNNISINGLPGPYTAVLLDGTPIYGSLASVYGLNGIPSMIIDRFEVIKGPGSTLYGSEAVAGVINIITKNPAGQPDFSVDVMGTSHRESFGNLAGALKGKTANGFIGLNYAYLNRFEDDNGDGFSDNINMDRYSLFTKWDFVRKSNKTFTLAAKYYHEDRRNGVREFLENRNYRTLRGDDDIYGESIYTNRVELFGTYRFDLPEVLKLDYSFTTHDQDSYYGADYYKAEQHIGFINLVWSKAVGSHNLLAGLTQRLQSYDDNTVATQDSTAAGIVSVASTQYIPGFFVQNEWTIKNRLTLLGGTRLDHHQAHGFILSPRFNLKYKLGAWTSLRANFGTGFRIVNLFAEDHAFVTGQRTVEVASDLKPESSYNGSLNINHVYTLGNSQGMIDIDAYYTYFTNKIIPDYDDPGKIIYSNSQGHAVTKGIGISLNHDFQFPLSINIGVNRQQTAQTENDDNGMPVTAPIEFAPEYSGVLTASYKFRKAAITLAYTARLTGTMALPEVYDLNESGIPLANPRPVRSATYSLHNVQVSKEFSRRWTLYGGVQNLLNYRQPVSPLVGFNDPNASAGFSDFFDTSYSFAPIHGREAYVGFRWTID